MYERDLRDRELAAEAQPDKDTDATAQTQLDEFATTEEVEV